MTDTRENTKTETKSDAKTDTVTPEDTDTCRQDGAKKSILVIFTGALELGGIEQSLIGLLDAFDYDRYDVDLFLYAHHGPLFRFINPKVNLLPEVKELAYLRESFAAKIKHGCFYAAALRLRDEVKSWFTKGKGVNHERSWKRIVEKCAPHPEKHYDVALSFFLPFDYLLEKVDATCKVSWVHTDYSWEKADRDALRREYGQADLIAAVSEGCRDTFCEIFPEFAEKTIVIENILDEKLVRQRADEFTVEDEMPDVAVREADSFDTMRESIGRAAASHPDETDADSKSVPGYQATKLLTIGRFSPPKKIEDIPEICRRLIGKGLNVTWYIIGFGGLEELIKQRIKEAGMEKHVIILGAKENPYPYIRACDIYVQPSRYEGKSIAVREAQMLHKPVIITDYPTAKSQLEDGVDGVIVPLDTEGCAEGIARVIEDEALRERLTENTKKRDYMNAGEVEKIYKLVREEAL